MEKFKICWSPAMQSETPYWYCLTVSRISGLYVMYSLKDKIINVNYVLDIRSTFITKKYFKLIQHGPCWYFWYFSRPVYNTIVTTRSYQDGQNVNWDFVSRNIYTILSKAAVLSIKLTLRSSVGAVPSSGAIDTLVPGKTDMTDTLVSTWNFKSGLR